MENKIVRLKTFEKFNESENFNSNILKIYVDAYDFCKYIETEFGIDSSIVRKQLLDDDYIEGSLGSIWSLDDYTQTELDNGNEIAKWYESFLINFDIESVRLKY